MKQIEADVAVVAGGISGLAAAVSAAEKGASVLVFEKSKVNGGIASMAMGPFGVESRVQKRQLDTLTKGEAFKLYMDYAHWRIDSRLVKAYIDKSGDTINWLEDMGVEWAFAARHFQESQATWHLPKLSNGSIGRGSGAMITKVLRERADELGVEFYMETPVKKIIKDGDHITGIIAEDKNGETIQANAKAVIICTGGFGDNPEMIKEYTGYEYGKNMFSFRIPGLAGEGIKMAYEVGAAQSDINMEMYYQTAAGEHFQTLDSAFRQPNLLVNLNGERFFDEAQMANTTYCGNSISMQKNACAYMIFDEAAKRYYDRNGFDMDAYDRPVTTMDEFGNEFERYIQEGKGTDFIMADSIEEIAERTGINAENLKATVDEYNQYCNSYDKLYEKANKYLRPIRKAKFYAGKLIPSAFGSTGGIKINYKTEVLNKEYDKIPGLYAAGMDACSLYKDSYIFKLPGNSMGFALNSGRIAGENAAEYIYSF